MNKNNVIVLENMEGNEETFELLDLITYKGNQYVVLLPLHSEDEVPEVMILKGANNNDLKTESYIPVGEHKTLQQIFDIFRDRNQDVYDFED